MQRLRINMFVAMQAMESSYLWSGIIWMLVMGLAAGNYACSLIHRLPRGRLLLDKAPYCGNCGELLQVRDLFPVVSAVLLRHRCRYCKTSFPISHTVTELLLAVLFVVAFLQYDFGDMAVLIAAIGSFLVILAAIEVNENLIMGKVMLCVLVVGMLLRTHVDGQLFGFVLGGLYGVISGAIIWRKSITREGHIYRLPQQAELMAMAGVCVGAKVFPLFLVLFVVTYVIIRLLSYAIPEIFRITIPFSIAIILSLLFG